MGEPQQDIVVELTVTEAACILGVSRRTVLRFVQRGALRFRSAAVPNSLRPRYRIPRTDVVDLRNRYHLRTTTPAAGKVRGGRATSEDRKLLGFE